MTISKVISFPNGVEYEYGSKDGYFVFIHCTNCKLRVPWIKREKFCPLERTKLPDGWTGGVGLMNFILCPECTKVWEKSRKIYESN